MPIERPVSTDAAYVAGVDAFNRDPGDTINPYPANEAAAEAWEQGFLDAQKEASKEDHKGVLRND